MATDAETAETAQTALRAALESVGLRQSADATVSVNGVPIRVTALNVTAHRVTAHGVEVTTAVPTIDVHVASVISTVDRNARRRAGTSWLDLRGHLYLSGPGVLVDTAVPPLLPRAGRTDPFAGPAGMEVACALLLEPQCPQPVRSLARVLRRAPSTVSEVLGALRALGLARHDARPVVPELFWAAAAHWWSAPTWLASAPDPTQAPEWVLAVTEAARWLGAPVGLVGSSTTAGPAVPEFYVPDHGTLAHAATMCGRATAATAAACIRVAPVPALCEQRIGAHAWVDQPWPVAQPLFVALDLAQDQEGGRDTLDGWTGPTSGRRVW